jgi:hypothetical protein
VNALGVALIALGVGLAAGLAIAVAARVGQGTRRAEADGVTAQAIDGRLQAQSAEIRRLADATRAQDAADERLAAELRATRQTLEVLRVREEERRGRDADHAEVVRRLSSIMAGSAAKGRAGENVLREQLASLPPGMLVSDFRVNGRVVEYGLLLPDGRRLPIDAKWPAPRELEVLESCDDPDERERVAREVERIVAVRAREVAAYLDPALTAPVAVAAVPDAAYSVLRRAHSDAFSRGVVIVPFTAALPVLLFLYSLVSRYGSTGDIEHCLTELCSVLDAMEAVFENKLARATTMLANGADELRAQLGKARGSIVRARASGLDSVDRLPPVGGGDRSDRPELLRVIE